MPPSPHAITNAEWVALLDRAGLIAAVLDPQGRIRSASSTLCDAAGLTMKDLQHLDWAGTFLPPSLRERFMAWIDSDAALAPMVVPAPLEGPVRQLRWHAIPLRDPIGMPRGAAVLGVPLSQAGVASNARLAEFYRALSEMGQAILRASDAGQLYRNLCQIALDCGHAMTAWVGLIDNARVVPVAHAGAAEAYVMALNLRVDDAAIEGGPTLFALKHGRPSVSNDFLNDERTHPWRALAAPHGVRASAAFPIHRGGRVTGSLNLYFGQAGMIDDALTELFAQLVSDLCFALDALDRDEARAAAERTARERELQLAGIVETALDAIITVNASFEIVVFNGAAARMFGVDRQEALGGSLDRFVPQEYRDAHRAHLARYAATGVSSRRMGHSRELTGIRANGERFPIEASISRVGEGDRMLMTVMARDVTQLRQAEKAQLAHAAAEAANRAKTEFLSRISHELRTPLNAVLGFAQLMRADTQDALSPHHREQIELVLQAGEHLRTLIDETLDVTRIETGRMAMEVRDFELCELLNGAMQMCEPQARQAGVTLEAAYRPKCTMLLRADPGRLRQVLLNLLSNAIKYNRPGGRVRVELTRDPHFVHILVRDNGLGMSAAQKAQLFQPFNRLGREHSGVEGSGIGLVLARQLVGLMGGELSIDSELDHGTVAKVILPAGDTRPMATLSPATARPDASLASPEGLVLYVEDNPINAILVEQILSRWPKTQLVVAGDGASGLVQARALLPDVILLDMQLPDMDGLNVLRRLKGDAATRDMCVVALSANAVEADIRAARAAGALDYWTKPIDFDHFVQGMRELLERARAASLRPGA